MSENSPASTFESHALPDDAPNFAPEPGNQPVVPESKPAEPTLQGETFKVPSSGADPIVDLIQQSEFKDLPYMQDILKSNKPSEALFKKLDGAQKLIGTRIQIPNETSSPEQVKEFHKQLGVPDDFRAYQLPEHEWKPEDKEIGEFITKSRNSTIVDAVKEVAQKEGVTPKQLAALTKAMESKQAEVFRTEIEAETAKQKTDASQFTIEMNNMFGQRASQVMENGQRLIRENVPPAVRAALADPNVVSPKALAVFASALDGITQKYIKGDSFGGTQNAQSSTLPTSVDEVRAEGRRLMALPAYTDPRHPQHEYVKRQVDENYKRLPK